MTSKHLTIERARELLAANCRGVGELWGPDGDCAVGCLARALVGVKRGRTAGYEAVRGWFASIGGDGHAGRDSSSPVHALVAANDTVHHGGPIKERQAAVLEVFDRLIARRVE